MDRRRIQILLLASIMFSVSTLFADTIPGRWEKVERLEAGFPIVVKLKSGEEYKADFVRLEGNNLFIQEREGSEISIHKEHVKEVASQKHIHNDSLWQGPVIGGAIGAAISIPGAKAWSNEGGTSGEIAGLVALSAGIGAGLGLLGDASIKAREVYYKAPKK